MKTTDIAEKVNNFMLKQAPTIPGASPMAYDILKALARKLVYEVGTTEDHAQYVMYKKYGHAYAQSTVKLIVDEAMTDHIAERIEANRTRRENRRMAMLNQQPALLHFA